MKYCFYPLLLGVFLTGCLFYRGTVDIDILWEDEYGGHFTTCHQAGVDQMTWRIVDDYGDVVKDSHGMVSCRDNITRSLMADDDYMLEIEGYIYDYWDDMFYLEWEALCVGILAKPKGYKRYVCEVDFVDWRDHPEYIKEVDSW